MTTRKQLVEVFTRAKEWLWDGGPLFPRSQNIYICGAINECHYLPQAHRESAVAIVSKRLQGAPTLKGWLIGKGIPEEDMTTERLQAHRHEILALTSSSATKENT